MKFLLISAILVHHAASFGIVTPSTRTPLSLFVSTGSIGLGPAEDQQNEKKELVAGVDYEVPDHESFRTSRRSKLDEQCDAWFGTLLEADGHAGILGDLADNARTILTTPVELKNEVSTAASVCNHVLYIVAHSTFLI